MGLFKGVLLSVCVESNGETTIVSAGTTGVGGGGKGMLSMGEGAWIVGLGASAGISPAARGGAWRARTSLILVRPSAGFSLIHPCETAHLRNERIALSLRLIVATGTFWTSSSRLYDSKSSQEIALRSDRWLSISARLAGVIASPSHPRNCRRSAR